MFVKWYAEYVLQVDGVYEYKEIPMHKCSEKELAKFHAPAKTSIGLANRYREDWMCLDWTDVVLSGMDPSDNTRTIDVMFLPCNMKGSLLGDGLEDNIPEGCNYDRDELIKYLGSLQMLIYAN